MRTARATPSVMALVFFLALTTACSSESAAAPPASTTRPSTTTTTVARTTTSVNQAPNALVPPKVPKNGAYIGTWRGPGPNRADNPMVNLASAEQSIGRKYAIDHQFYDWGAAIPSPYEYWTASKGRIPMVSLCACHFKDGSVVRWATIASGNDDKYLISIARGFVALHSPSFFVFDAEPETNVGTRGTANDYVAAFRHIVAVFRAQKATNVAFVWATTGYAWQPASGQASLVKSTYPGDEVVDWISLDPYNFFYSGQWHSLSFEMNDWYSWATSVHPTKPLAFTEWGSKEDPSVPGRKAAWFRDALAALQTKYTHVHAAVYFDERKLLNGKVYDWRIDTSASSLSAFAKLANSSWFAAKP
jgi:hypothetical protein